MDVSSKSLSPQTLYVLLQEYLIRHRSGASISVLGFAFQLFHAARQGYLVLHDASAIGDDASRLRTFVGFEQIR